MKNNLEDIKALRARSGASIMAVKSALADADGDFEKALLVLQKMGAVVAKKKEGRAASAGIVDAYLHHDLRVGVLLELKSETDFVARNQEFKSLAHGIAMHIAATDPENHGALLEEPFIRDESRKIIDLITEASAKFGERIEISRFTRYEI